MATTTSRAVWFTGPRQAELLEQEVPPPAPGEIQVTSEYSLISPGSEMNLYRGEGNLPDVLLPTARGQIPFPVSFAYQTLGTVSAVPEDSAVEVGCRVFCAHPHQGLFNIPDSPMLVDRVPDGVPSRRAVFGRMFGVALNALLDAPARVGDSVAVSGLGLVGHFCAYLARRNALRLILIDPLEQRRSRAQWIGADAVVDVDAARTAIDELTDGRGVDLFIEVSGAPGALQLALETTGDGGTIDVSAWYGTRRAELLLSPEFHLRRHRVLSSHVGALGAGTYPGWNNARASQAAFEFLATIDENNFVSHEMPFSRAPEAYAMIDARPHETLGVLLVHDQA